MNRWRWLILLLVLAGLYLAFWPVAVEPVAWSPEPDPGLERGAFAPTALMTGATLVDLDGHEGPEDLALGPDGAIYTGTLDGAILRYDPETGRVDAVADTGGRPLGLEFGPDGALYVADAYRGLLAIDLREAGGGRGLAVLATEAGGARIKYANSLVVAGRKVYFTDASTRFGAQESGGTLAASVLELVEHGASGRVLEHDLDSGKTAVLAKGFAFANGLALTADGAHLVLAETGGYRLLKIGLSGAERGAVSVLIDNLPGFPDNIERGPDGLYWVGLTSPRLAGMDALAEYPALRKLVMRLPPALKPKPLRHGAVLAVDASGRVRASIQDPSGGISTTSAALLTDDALYVARLEGRNFARISPPPAIRE